MTEPKRLGFRSRKPDAMTNLERQRKWRSQQGHRTIGAYTLHPEAAAALLYLRKSWNFTTNQECLEAALRYLAIQTRRGLQRLDLDI